MYVKTSTLKNMKVLIIGSDGMLGQSLCQVFKANDLTCWKNDDLDITQEQIVREKIVKLSPDVIINAAAYTDVDGAETNKETAFAINESGVRNIAKAVKDIGGVLVHYSTDYVFPGSKEEGYEENDPPGPAVNAYGESKLAGERAVIEAGPNFYLIRTAWLYGPGGKNFIEIMLKLAESKKGINVVDDQHGNPTYTKDLANVTKEIIDGDYEYGIYHAVNDEVTTWYDFASTIFSEAGLDIEVEPIKSSAFKRPAKRPEWGVLKNTKGPKMRSWRLALRDYLKERK